MLSRDKQDDGVMPNAFSYGPLFFHEMLNCISMEISRLNFIRCISYEISKGILVILACSIVFIRFTVLYKRGCNSVFFLPLLLIQ